MTLHVPSLLLTLPVLAGAVVATVAPAVPTEPTVELADTPGAPALSTDDCRLLPPDRQPAGPGPGTATPDDVQRIVLYVPATTCNTPDPTAGR